MITETKIHTAQKRWADGILEIGHLYRQQGDYRRQAAKFVEEFYAYDRGEVLFKPTLAADSPFRGSVLQALSYFVGGEVEEDKGFALMPWCKIHFGDQRIILQGDTGLSMGNYYFTRADNDEELRVEFTFGYVYDEKGDLRIQLHHSSLPYDNKI